ncbi:4-hydroxy-3-polyprenylbenzoate decarboxylase [Paenibacillus forsythiae]|uniref:Flavin prenyltransferase UbiX n=1 Tax=Paenibacillus forsythiae TaxID=365616 RepID=A0ABU3H436_9BACL|nr:UbiX family flavin prenyltransferase [Paenibacillus forsythiae]MDT3425584.1 4-hydroxy-3-polyprenylbenzoate decarboxylase [Paenibacillus forsythiae]
MDIVVGISGATGTVYAVKLLEMLREQGVNTHVIISGWAKANLEVETTYKLSYLEGLATYLYDNRDLGAKVSSGSFLTDGMIVLPCSMKTLAAIASGFTDSLISRTADVMMKEGRKLVLSPRETPLNAIHLENMLKLARIGVRIVPPMPSFYNNPQTIDDLITHQAMKILDQFGIHLKHDKRWNGTAAG